MPMTKTVDGSTSRRFERLREVLASNLSHPSERGQAVCVVIDGETVVDLWGGYMDHACERPWKADTMACIFSIGKTLVAMTLADLIARGDLALDDRVIDYWPEYGQMGKAATTVDHLLSHRAGVPGAFGAPPGSAYDWHAMVRAIEQQAPMWPPGRTGCYHTFTYGHLGGALARRITGLPIEALVESRIATPLGLELGFGLDERTQSCVADISTSPNDKFLASMRNPQTLMGRCWAALPLGPDQEDFNRPQFRSAVMPACNGHATARALAQLFCSLAMAKGRRGPPQLISASTADLLTEEQWSGVDALGLPHRMARGLRLKFRSSRFNGGERSFGLSALGGGLAFGDPDLGLGFGFVTNHLAAGASPFSARLVAAVNDSLA